MLSSSPQIVRGGEAMSKNKIKTKYVNKNTNKVNITAGYNAIIKMLVYNYLEKGCKNA